MCIVAAVHPRAKPRWSTHAHVSSEMYVHTSDAWYFVRNTSRGCVVSRNLDHEVVRPDNLHVDRRVHVPRMPVTVISPTTLIALVLDDGFSRLDFDTGYPPLAWLLRRFGAATGTIM